MIKIIDNVEVNILDYNLKSSQLMDSGDPGAPGVAVLRHVDMVRRSGLENVILLLQLMEEILVLGIEVSLKGVTNILAPMVKVIQSP